MLATGGVGGGGGGESGGLVALFAGEMFSKIVAGRQEFAARAEYRLQPITAFCDLGFVFLPEASTTADECAVGRCCPFSSIALHMSTPATASQSPPPPLLTQSPQQQQQQTPPQKMSAWVWVVGAGAAAFFVRLPIVLA